MYETTTKMKVCYEHRKTHDLINKKDSFDRESFYEILSQITNKIGTGWNKIKKFSRHDQTEVVSFFCFFAEQDRLHSAPVVQFPFG